MLETSLITPEHSAWISLSSGHDVSSDIGMQQIEENFCWCMSSPFFSWYGAVGWWGITVIVMDRCMCGGRPSDDGCSARKDLAVIV